MIPFKPGYCAHCGAQSMIRNLAGQPVVGRVGTKVCWLVLSDPEQDRTTRIGTFTLCEKCHVGEVDHQLVKGNLTCAGSLSGITENEPEFGMYPNMHIEVVKTYGE